MRRHRRWQIYRFGSQNHMEAGLPVLGLKTGGASSAAGWRWWRTHGVTTKLVSKRSRVVKVACSSSGQIKTWTVILLRSIWVVCLMEGHFGHLPERPYRESMVEGRDNFASLISRSSRLVVRVRIRV